MAKSPLLEAIPKAPFANYDIVVYFGGGLFAVPFVNRYIIQPTGLHWPQYNIAVGSTIASEITAGLSLLFSLYIVGHMLAYASSELIEKTVDRFFGKISTSILISAVSLL